MYNKVIHFKISVLVGKTIDKKSKDKRRRKKRRRRRSRGRGKEAEKTNKQDNHFFSDKLLLHREGRLISNFFSKMQN